MCRKENLMTRRMNIAVFGLISAFLIGGCSTVKAPNLDFLKIPEFKEAAQKLIEGYPNVADAPEHPENIRSAEEWDKAAKALIAKRNLSYSSLHDDPVPASEAELLARLEALRAEVRSYKLDDPQ